MAYTLYWRNVTAALRSPVHSESGPERAGTEFRGHQNHHLTLWARNLLSPCQNLGLWLTELCSKVLNPETVSATDLS